MKTLKSFTSLIFALISLVLVVIVSLGISLDFDKLKTAAFWLEVFIKWCLTMILFNIAFEYDKQNKTHDRNSRFYSAFATLKVRIREIHKEKRYNALSSAIALKNENNVKELWTARLHRYCAHISYDDIFNTEKTFDEISDFYCITRHRKRFIKVCKQIKQGAEYKHLGLFPYKPIKEEYFLKDNELSAISTDKYDYSSKTETAKRNLSKSTMFFVVSIISAIITYSFFAENFWGELVSNLFTMVSAMASGFSYSVSDVKNKTQIYENRNDFLERYLNITTVYKP